MCTLWPIQEVFSESDHHDFRIVIAVATLSQLQPRTEGHVRVTTIISEHTDTLFRLTLDDQPKFGVSKSQRPYRMLLFPPD